jgi:hypothetical protein
VPFLLDLNLLLVPYLNTVARARDEAVLLELKLPEDSAARSSDATPGLLLCFVALQFFFAMPITLSDHPPSTFRNWWFFTSGLVALACPGGGGALCKELLPVVEQQNHFGFLKRNMIPMKISTVLKWLIAERRCHTSSAPDARRAFSFC